MREWKPLSGYENYYSISNDGQLVRIATFGGKKRWKPSAIRQNKYGYIKCRTCVDGKKIEHLAHRLVWQTFCGPIPDGMEINHKNGKKHDNRLENLEVCNHSYNIKHSFRVLGRTSPNNPSLGSRNGSSKLTERDIPVIIRLYQSGLSQKDIGKKYGVSQRTISLVTRREKWKHVLLTTHHESATEV